MGAPFIQQYNQFPSVSVSGSAAEGVSSRTAMAAMEQILQAHLRRWACKICSMAAIAVRLLTPSAAEPLTDTDGN